MERGLAVEPELERFIHDNQNNFDDALLQESIMESSFEIDFKEQELALLRKSVEQCRDKRKAEEQRLYNLERLADERSKSLESKAKQLSSVQRQLSCCCRDVDAKEKEHVAILRRIEEGNIDVKLKEERLKTLEKRIGECERMLRLKEDELNWQMDTTHRMVSEHDEVEKKLLKGIEECEKDLGAKEARLSVIEGLLREREQELNARDLEFHLDFEWKEEERKAVLLKIEECNKEIRAKEEELDAMQKLINGQGKELQFKRKNLIASMREKSFQLDKKEKDFELRKKEFEGRVKDLEKIEDKVKDFESKQKGFEGRVKEHESEKKQFVRRVYEFESKEKQIEGRKKELELKQKHFEVQMKEFESKEKQFVGQVKVHESKENEFEVRMKILESREKLYDGRMQELDSKEKRFEIQLEGQMKELESKKKQYEQQVKELEMKEAQFEVKLKELESNNKHFEQQVKDLKTKQTQFERKQKELEFKEKQCKSFEQETLLKEKSSILYHHGKTGTLNFIVANREGNSNNVELLFNVLKEHELICSQVSDTLRTSVEPTKLVLDTIKGFCPPQLGQQVVEREASILRRTFNLLLDELKKSTPVISFHVKDEAIKLARDWKAGMDLADKGCLEVLDFLKFIATYEIGSSFEEIELQSLLYIVSQHCQAPQIHGDIEKLPDNQSSPTTIDGGNSQLLSDEPKLMDSDILARLRASPDPSKLVLDIIQKPIFSQNREGNEGIIIDESHIFLFEQLMRISPHIKPEVREEARKLALDLKESMRGSNENSCMVLGFLLLLSIYGLISYFDEDEILKLIEVTAQHKQAVELFQSLGFADKINDFVQNLIMKKRHVEAVRFICAYKLADKFKPVNLLRQHKEYVKRFFRRGRKKCTERKVMAKDNEIASLVAALECISNNHLESQDLVDEINERIFFLEKHKEYIVRGALESSLKVEMPQPEEKNLANEEVNFKDQVQHEEKRPANEAFTKNQVHQPKGIKHANGAVTKNQVQQPAKKRAANKAVTKKQARQLKGKKHAKRAVSKNQTEVKQPDQRKSVDEGASSVNHVERHQPELEKCATDTVTVNQVQQLQQKKRSVETVSGNHQFSQWSNNNKRPRTAEGCSAPPVYTSYSDYRSAFIPTSRMSPQLGFPTGYFGPHIVAAPYGNREIDYYYHPGPPYPFR